LKNGADSARILVRLALSTQTVLFGNDLLQAKVPASVENDAGLEAVENRE